MKTANKKTTAKEPGIAVPVSAPESKQQPVAIAPRVVRRGTCSTLSSKGGDLSYEIGVDSRGEVHLRVVENSGSGSFSDDWVAFKAIQAAFDRAPKSEPISAFLLHRLFAGRSSNCCFFCAAVLKSEGLLLPSEKQKKRFDRVDPTAWLADMRNRAEGSAADTAGQKSSKKHFALKADASKPKKGNKSAKT